MIARKIGKPSMTLISCLSAAAFWGLSGCGGPGPENKTAAQWALKLGGTVDVSESNSKIKSVDELPEESFYLHRIDLNQVEPPVTDADLEHLTQVDELKYLGLHSARITDKGLDHLLKVPSLQELELSYTEIGDDGLDKLRGLPNLVKLYLFGTNVSAEAVERFKKSRPDCKLFRD